MTNTATTRNSSLTNAPGLSCFRAEVYPDQTIFANLLFFSFVVPFQGSFGF